MSSHVLLPALLLVLLGLLLAVQGHAVHEEHACSDHTHTHGSPEDAHPPHPPHHYHDSLHAPPEGASGIWLHQHLPTGEWAKAFGATAVISIFPTLILPFIPLTSAVNGVVSLNEGVHKLLLSFAAGGLLGEVFLHSLPHLLEHHDHFSSSSSSSSSSGHQHDESEQGAHDDGNYHKHSHAHGGGGGGVRLEEGEVMRICLWILAGFLLFFVSEKTVAEVLGDEGGHGHSHGHGHAHTHSHAAHGKTRKARALSSEDEEGEEEEEEGEEEEEEEEDSVDSQGVRRRSPRIHERYSGSERRQIATVAAAAAGGRNNGGGVHRRKLSPLSSPKKQQQQLAAAAAAEKEKDGGWSGLKAGGYLNIVVDVLHNLTDGIAIGASFASGQGVGLATTLSVFLHEVPHEIGDFAILVQSGLSVRNAFLMQFFTAIAAFLGTFLGLVAKRQEGLERVLLALTTGGFLYVACVSVLPELLAKGGKGVGGGGQAVREVGGVLAGIGLMAWVAMGEHGHEH